ncbi:MAG: hypothetical protein JWN35_2782 [Frankiales bacterium]|jgi:hypothetical protein|nr:hypothetical protein [Frankiales bacterium]
MGKVGRVIVRVRGEDSPGEVLLTVAGAPETYLAYSPDVIASGSEVLVVHDRGARGVDVVPWEIAPPGPDADGVAGRRER